MRLAFRIALRFLKSGKGQTVLIMLGISVGVAVQLFIGSLIQGLQINLIDTTIGNSSHITITSTSDEKTIQQWERGVYESEPGYLVRFPCCRWFGQYSLRHFY